MASDDGAAGLAAAAEAGIATADLKETNWATFDALVLAPGIPLTHPEPHWAVHLAKLAGVEVIGDLELFARERRLQPFDVPFIAITGTNGKSTTTALTAHILREAGRDVEVGGNIGTAMLSLRALRARAPLRDRVLLLSDRSGAEHRSDGRRPAQHHARSSRPARHDRELRRREGAAAAQVAECRDRHRRRLLPRDRGKLAQSRERRRPVNNHAAVDARRCRVRDRHGGIAHRAARTTAAQPRSPTLPASGPCAACTMPRMPARRRRRCCCCPIR